jgi:hypothetical protein
LFDDEEIFPETAEKRRRTGESAGWGQERTTLPRRISEHASLGNSVFRVKEKSA